MDMAEVIRRRRAELLQLGQQVSYVIHPAKRSKALDVVLDETPTGLIGPTGNRAERVCVVCAPPTVEPRTPRTPIRIPYKGCAAGCAVGGANPAPAVDRWRPAGGGGVVR
jgi:hypothetical protein